MIETSFTLRGDRKTIEPLAAEFQDLDGLETHISTVKPSLTSPTIIGQSPMVDLVINIAGTVTATMILQYAKELKLKETVGVRVVRIIRNGVDQTKRFIDSTESSSLKRSRRTLRKAKRAGKRSNNARPTQTPLGL